MVFPPPDEETPPTTTVPLLFNTTLSELLLGCLSALVFNVDIFNHSPTLRIYFEFQLLNREGLEVCHHRTVEQDLPLN